MDCLETSVEDQKAVAVIVQIVLKLKKQINKNNHLYITLD